MPGIRHLIAGRRGGLTLLALTTVVVGATLIGFALHAQQSPPTAPHSVGQVDPASTRQVLDAPLAASQPVRIRIRSIGVDTPVYPIGLAPDGSLQAPEPGPHLNNAAWFKNSPTPGQPGPAIIEGHVDTATGPSVFLRLGAIRPGDTIDVTRKDGVQLQFTVNAVREVQKSSFPTQLVYGGKDLTTPTLRLITCSNFDRSIRHYVGNEIVFAQLTKVRHRVDGIGPTPAPPSEGNRS